MGEVILGVNYQGEWVERSKCYAWVPKVKESRPILVPRDVTYDVLLNKIIGSWGIRDNPRDICITYMLSVAANQKTPPVTIRNDDDVRLYMADVDRNGARPTLRVIVVSTTEECVGSNDQEMPNSGGHDFSQRLDDLHEEVEEEDRGGGVEEDRAGVDVDEEKEEEVEDKYVEEHPAIYTPVFPTQSSEPIFHFVDGTGFEKGMTFPNKKEPVTKLKIAAVKHRFNYKPLKNTAKIFNARCLDVKCKWWLRAMRYKSNDRFYISVYNNMHTCGVQHHSSHNSHASARIIGEFMKGKYLMGKGPTTKAVRESLNNDFGCKVSYWKCLRVCQFAKSLTRGTHAKGIEILDAYAYMVRSKNPGTKTDLRLSSTGKFLYFFLSYGAWIRGFTYVRKVLAVDGTHLSGEYGGVLLSAVAQDAMSHVFPVAFCVVDKECDASYEYFFEQLRCIVSDSEELCIVSDRHPSISKMVAQMFPSAHYGVCMWHLGESIRTKFQFGFSLHKYYTAAKAYRVEEFNDAMNEIRAIDWRVADYLENVVGYHRWSRLYFPGNRFEVMTSNIAESINSMLKEQREYPIAALFKDIGRSFAEKFHTRAMKLINHPNLCVPDVEIKIRKNKEVGDKLVVNRKGTYGFEIISPGHEAEVDLYERTCTCREFDLDQLPCVHAMAAIRGLHGDEYGSRVYEYTSGYYTTQAYILDYAEPVNAVPPEESWVVPAEEILYPVPLPPKPNNRGRRRVNRIRSIGERLPKRRNKCGNCKRYGHKKTTCPVVCSGNEATSQPKN